VLQGQQVQERWQQQQDSWRSNRWNNGGGGRQDEEEKDDAGGFGMSEKKTNPFNSPSLSESFKGLPFCHVLRRRRSMT